MNIDGQLDLQKDFDEGTSTHEVPSSSPDPPPCSDDSDDDGHAGKGEGRHIKRTKRKGYSSGSGYDEDTHVQKKRKCEAGRLVTLSC